MYEIMTKEHYRTFYTFVATSEGIFGLIVNLYFWFVSKNTQGILFFGFFCLSIATIGVFFSPESPRYLVKLGDLEYAREVFDKIASKNGSKPLSDL